ncbi:MAG: TonB-dependent receptor [Blastocatellia bacterium]|nr:TonB-dependent receptor [Blastocatellia bacterium]
MPGTLRDCQIFSKWSHFLNSTRSGGATVRQGSQLPGKLTGILLMILGLSAATFGQGPLSILSGTITDQSGAVVSGAQIKLKAATGTTLETVSTERGTYSFTNLAKGTYTVLVERSGFAPSNQQVQLESQAGSLDFLLAPAPLSDVITVSDTATAIESTLKLSTTLHETPRAITIIGAERIREQNFKSVVDAFAYVPGVAVNSFRTGGYHFYARGYRMLPEETRVDGFVGINAGGRYGASLFGVEQAVLLRGPAGLQYGSSGSPGGFINLITKKPQELRTTRIDFQFGGYAGNGRGFGDGMSGNVEIDSTGALLSNQRILYRTLAKLENSNYFTNHVLDRNRYFQTALTFKLDSLGKYTLTPLVQWTRFNRPAGGGIVISPSTSLSTNDKANGPINLKDLSPLGVNLSAGGGIDQTLQAGFDFRANPTLRWKASLGYRFIGLDTFIDQFTPQVSTPAQIAQLLKNQTVERTQTKSDTERGYHNFDFTTSYEVPTNGWWKNMVQVGAYSRLARTRVTVANGPVPGPQSPINIYTGQAVKPLVFNYPTLRYGNPTDTTFWNTYVQNRTALANNKVVVTFGLSYGQNHQSGIAVRKSDLIPNFSLVYNVTRELSLYGSYATSFNPTDPDAEDLTGRKGTFGPIIGRNYEFGAKYDLPSRRASISASYFHNRLDNSLVQSGPNDFNANGNRYFVQAGGRRSRGVEVTTEVQPFRDLRVIGSFSYLDAIYEGGGPASAAPTTAIPGSRAEKSPRWSYSVWNRYDRSEGKFKGFGAGLGIVWQDERLGGNGARTPSAPDPLLLPAFTKVDAALYYRLNERVDFGVNFENLFDKVIFVSGTVGSNLEIAAPRTITFRTGFRF